MNELNKRIKYLRKQTNMSQSQFSIFFDLPKSTLQDWEQGNRVPPRYVVSMMERILNLEYFKKERFKEEKIIKKEYLSETMDRLYVEEIMPDGEIDYDIYLLEFIDSEITSNKDIMKRLENGETITIGDTTYKRPTVEDSIFVDKMEKMAFERDMIPYKTCAMACKAIVERQDLSLDEKKAKCDEFIKKITYGSNDAKQFVLIAMIRYGFNYTEWFDIGVKYC